MSSLRRICLDTSSWIAFLKGEAVHDIASLQGIMKAFDDSRLILLVPAVVICELAASDRPEMAAIFEQALLRDNVEQLDITVALAREAGALRQRVRANQWRIKTPDALVVAAASHHRADLLISEDAGIRRLNGMSGIECKIGAPHEYFNDEPLLNPPPSLPR